ncbi:hypothetical protein QPK31_24085 [Massilia sp. YIM B02769]|uniref:LamG-like jellyroll fold domain-containing protein n=1 Tax=Massilia sp. YIM B02769 TaxID=3050129 RepID=UPI0025B66B82|nr:LamG-like jellyroll fold domain-containing protein [Massilia sp. YIM B02769]MDN4061304.1 hypothetical protein [Massilia sp. YIM B02769]
MAGMRYQPQGKLQLNRQHTLAPALRLLSLPGVHRGFDAVAQQAATTVGVKVVSTPDGAVGGFGAAVGAGSTDRITTGLVGDFPLSGRSYIFRFRRNGGGGGNLGRLFDKTSSGGGQFLMWYGSRAAISYGFYAGSSTERNIDIPGTATTAAVGQDCILIVAHAYDGASSTINAYVNGQRVLNDSVVAGVLRDAPSVPLTIGNRASDGARVWDGSIEFAGVIDLVLSPDQATALSGGIYQVLANPYADDQDEAQPRSYTLTAAAGAFAVTGSPAGLRVARRLAAAPAGFSLAGAAAALRAVRRLSVEPGAFALAGSAAGLRAARKFAAAPGVFSLAGGVATLVAARRLSAAPGSFAVVGQVATLVHTAAPAPGGPTYVLTASPGGFALAGAPAALVVARRITAGAGSFGIGSSPVSLTAQRRLAVGPGAFDVVGAAALLKVARRLSANPGTFTVAGSDVMFRQGAQIEYARAPAGSGYTPRRQEYQSRPAQVSTGGRLPARQENYR